METSVFFPRRSCPRREPEEARPAAPDRTPHMGLPGGVNNHFPITTVHIHTITAHTQTHVHTHCGCALAQNKQYNAARHNASTHTHSNKHFKLQQMHKHYLFSCSQCLFYIHHTYTHTHTHTLSFYKNKCCAKKHHYPKGEYDCLLTTELINKLCSVCIVWKFISILPT